MKTKKESLTPVVAMLIVQLDESKMPALNPSFASVHEQHAHGCCSVVSEQYQDVLGTDGNYSFNSFFLVAPWLIENQWLGIRYSDASEWLKMDADGFYSFEDACANFWLAKLIDENPDFDSQTLENDVKNRNITFLPTVGSLVLSTIVYGLNDRNTKNVICNDFLLGEGQNANIYDNIAHNLFNFQISCHNCNYIFSTEEWNKECRETDTHNEEYLCSKCELIFEEYATLYIRFDIKAVQEHSDFSSLYGYGCYYKLFEMIPTNYLSRINLLMGDSDLTLQGKENVCIIALESEYKKLEKLNKYIHDFEVCYLTEFLDKTPTRLEIGACTEPLVYDGYIDKDYNPELVFSLENYWDAITDDESLWTFIAEEKSSYAARAFRDVYSKKIKRINGLINKCELEENIEDLFDLFDSLESEHTQKNNRTKQENTSKLSQMYSKWNSLINWIKK